MRFKKILIILMFLVLSFFTIAQQGGNYEIEKSTLDAGGGHSEGGVFSLDGSIGQADAANESTGAGFTVAGGFWSQGVRPDVIFKDSFEN